MYTNAMIRIFIKMLVFVFLLESSGAAVAQYCEHDLYPLVSAKLSASGSAQDSIQAAAISMDQSNANSVADNECGFCHVGTVKSLMLNYGLVSPDLTLPLALESFLISRTRSPDLPERPNWFFAA